MIVTFNFDGVLFEASGNPGECETFVRAIVVAPKKQNWWESGEQFYGKSIADIIFSKVCDPFKAHYGTCGAPDCPIGPDGKQKHPFLDRIKRHDTGPKPVCSECNDTGIQSSSDNVNWIAGESNSARFVRDCSGVH